MESKTTKEEHMRWEKVDSDVCGGSVERRVIEPEIVDTKRARETVDNLLLRLQQPRH